LLVVLPPHAMNLHTIASYASVSAARLASRDVLLVAVAIAEGAKAAVAINRALLNDDGLG
jgi:hypothetical protein